MCDLGAPACLDDAHCLHKDAQLLYEGNLVQGFHACGPRGRGGLPAATALTHGIVVA